MQLWRIRVKMTTTKLIKVDSASSCGLSLASMWCVSFFKLSTLIRFTFTASVFVESYNTFIGLYIKMAHDAYFCNTWLVKLGNVVPVFPFPTRRIGRNYTGLDLVRMDIADHIAPCPKECRPRKHKDWLFC